jgi:hypothetical protein
MPPLDRHLLPVLEDVQGLGGDPHRVARRQAQVAVAGELGVGTKSYFRTRSFFLDGLWQGQPSRPS